MPEAFSLLRSPQQKRKAAIGLPFLCVTRFECRCVCRNRTIGHARSELGISDTEAWRYVTQNVMEGVVLPSSKRRQRFFASQQQIQLIIAEAQEPFRTFYGLAAETGLRPGELCGLTLDDWDRSKMRKNLLSVLTS
jgi:integrase